MLENSYEAMERHFQKDLLNTNDDVAIGLIHHRLYTYVLERCNIRRCKVIITRKGHEITLNFRL